MSLIARRQKWDQNRYVLNRAHLIALGLRSSACKANRPVSGRGQGRQLPKAGARQRQP
jgi:hypothetical protein